MPDEIPRSLIHVLRAVACCSPPTIHPDTLERAADRLETLELENQQLRVQTRELSRDALTGAWGRRVFDDVLASSLARFRRFGRNLGLILVDIDHFKALNDSQGHVAGDVALKRVAAALRFQIRESDTFARYGGEEFAVLVDGATGEGLLTLAERLSRVVERAQAGVTISAGAALARVGDTPEVFVQRADECLYAAKRAGRNTVRIAAEDTWR